MRTIIRACEHCGNALPKRHRRYCEHCSPLASLLWKREKRREWRGTRYYLDPWLKKSGGNENDARHLRSEYMRDYRAKGPRGSTYSSWESTDHVVGG